MKFKPPGSGESLCPHQLKRESKKWNLEDWKNFETYLKEERPEDQALWEIYLKKLETPLREALISHKRYNIQAKRIPAERYDENDQDRPSYCRYEKHLHGSIKILSGREREIIEGIFWDGKTERRLARELEINKTAVSIYKKRALDKIKEYMLNIHDEKKRKKRIV